MQIHTVQRNELDAVRRFVAEAPVPNILVLGVIDHVLSKPHARGFHLYGAWSVPQSPGPVPVTSPPAHRLRGVVLTGHTGLTVPWSRQPVLGEALGRFLAGLHRVGMLVGPRELCDSLWHAYDSSRRPRLFYDQRLFVARTPPDAPPPRGFRRARPRDAACLREMASHMMLEDLGYDPADRDAGHHARSIRQRIRRGLTWVWERDGELVFKIDIGAWCDEGVTVGGTYVPPRHRRQGLGAAGMRALCRVLLHTHPRVTLHVNEQNEAATRCYARAGFERADPFRLLLVD